MGGISFVLALCHSHPKLLLGGRAWLKGYMIPPCTLKTPCPIFPSLLCYRAHKGHSSGCSAAVHDAGMDFCCLSSSRWLLIWKIKWMKASRWKANHIEIPCLLFHYGTPTWNGCSSECNWAEAMFLYTGSIVASFAQSCPLFHWAVLKINRLWPYLCQRLRWRPHQDTICPPLSPCRHKSTTQATIQSCRRQSST